MATNVIHGTGKPRFVLPTEVLLGKKVPEDPLTTRTVTSATDTTVVVSGTPDLTTLDVSAGGLKGIQVWSLNVDHEDTWGVIQSFVDGTDTLTVDLWNNGNPSAGHNLYLQGRNIDLPYCQRLTETFSPDYIVKKMIDGRIVYIKRGFYYSASLDYGRYLHKDEMEIIRYLYEVSMNGCGFYPRKDNFAILYTVDIDPESPVSFYQLQSHQGHGGVVINIVGTRRLDRIPFSDPTTVVGDAIADDSTVPITDDSGVFITDD